MKYLRVIIPIAVVVLTIIVSGALRKPPEALPRWTDSPTQTSSAAGSTAQPVGESVIEVAVGDTFTLEFEANETTGFRWMAEHDAQKLESIKDEYVPDEVPEGGQPLLGSGGTHRFTFKAIEPGTAEIRFTYSRPWESVQPAKRIIYEVIIR